jgi:hypothetical protein
MQGRYHALAKERTMLLRCVEPPCRRWVIRIVSRMSELRPLVLQTGDKADIARGRICANTGPSVAQGGRGQSQGGQ